MIVIIFATVLPDKAIISSDAFSALIVMAMTTTMLTIPAVTSRLATTKEIVFRTS